MIMVHETKFHVLREVFEEIVAEDFASPGASLQEAGRDTLLAGSRIVHGFDPLWGEAPSVRECLFKMPAKYLNFGGELRVNAEFEIRMKKTDNTILTGDLLVACNMTNTNLKAENLMSKWLSDKDPLIMGFKSIKLEQNLLHGKVCACFMTILVRGINCYVLYYNDSHRSRMTLESS